MKVYQRKHTIVDSIVYFELVQRINTTWLTHICSIDLVDWLVYNKYAMSVSHGYIQVIVDGKKYLLHRLLMAAPNDKLVDHIDGVGVNNQRLNLRLCTNYENSQNKKGPNKGSKSGIIGVTWHTQNKKWQTRVVIGIKTYSLGCYYDKEMAEKAVYDFRRANLPFHTEVANVSI
jgi:hypothetical protein